MTIYLLSLHSRITGFPYPFRNSEQGKHDELAYLHLVRIFPQNREDGNKRSVDQYEPVVMLLIFLVAHDLNRKSDTGRCIRALLALHSQEGAPRAAAWAPRWAALRTVAGCTPREAARGRAGCPHTSTHSEAIPARACGTGGAGRSPPDSRG